MESFGNEGWKDEIEPPYEVLYSNMVDYQNCWNDSQLLLNNTTPKAIVLRIKLADIISTCDILLDVEEKHIIMRVPGKYRLKVNLKYNVNKLQGHAKWEKHSHQLIVTLPIEPKLYIN